MKKEVTLLLLFIFSIGCYGQQKVEDIYRKIVDATNNEVLVVAHRGDWRYAPENSLAAIAHSIKQGADIVELDVQKTKDGKLILMHDATLDRTTTGTGRVCDWTLDSIKTLFLRNGATLRTKHRVPTLEEALMLVKGKVMVNLDKAYPIFDEIYPLLKKTGTVRQVVMKGGNSVEEVMQDLGKYLDEILYMPVIQIDAPDGIRKIKEFEEALKPVAFELVFASDTCKAPKVAREMLKGKSRIWYNTLWDTLAGGYDDDKSLEDPDAGYGFLIDQLGATMIQTDRTAFLLEYLKSRGLHP